MAQLGKGGVHFSHSATLHGELFIYISRETLALEVEGGRGHKLPFPQVLTLGLHAKGWSPLLSSPKS